MKPVPDQWLEVMVTGGFKVWHIIFIIIALIVTMVVVYCCFHRCRIPRTKQEIEADLMRSNLTTKFRDYLQELPNEPTTFVEALKKVQDIEEKLEKDDQLLSRDLGSRKRMGWLKLKGKEKADKEPSGEANKEDEGDNGTTTKPIANDNETAIATSTVGAGQQEGQPLANSTDLLQTGVDKTKNKPEASIIQIEDHQPSVTDKSKATTVVAQKGTPSKELAAASAISNGHADKTTSTSRAARSAPSDKGQEQQPKQPKTGDRPARAKRKAKPNLSRTKAARVRSHDDSMDQQHNNQLELPAVNHHHHQHHGQPQRHHLHGRHHSTSRSRTSGHKSTPQASDKVDP